MFIEKLTLEKAWRIPKKIALVNADTGEAATYYQLNEKTSLLADFLFRKKKLNRYDLVCCISNPSFFSAALFFASISIGAIFLPLRPNSANLARSLKPKILFTDIFDKTSEPNLWPGSEIYPCSFSELGTPIQNKPIEEIETSEHDAALLFHEKEDYFAIIPYSMLLADTLASLIYNRITDLDKTASYFEFSCLEDFTMNFLPALIAGGTVVVGKETTNVRCDSVAGDLNFWTKNIKKIEAIKTKEVLLRTAKDVKELKNQDFKNMLKPVFSLRRAGIRAFEGTELSEKYLLKLGTSGYNMTAQIIKNGSQFAAETEAGEICLRGSNLFSGYWNHPKKSGEIITKGWTKTDLNGLVQNENFYLI